MMRKKTTLEELKRLATSQAAIIKALREKVKAQEKKLSEEGEITAEEPVAPPAGHLKNIVTKADGGAEE